MIPIVQYWEEHIPMFETPLDDHGLCIVIYFDYHMMFPFAYEPQVKQWCLANLEEGWWTITNGCRVSFRNRTHAMQMKMSI